MACPFQGVSARILLNFIKKYQDKFIESQPHSVRFEGKFFAVCNSSGTGKTKTILQVTNALPVHQTKWLRNFL
jgi:hypothetical protein